MSRAIIVTAGPLIASSATKIGTSQAAAVSGTNKLVLNGAAADAVANNICLSQTPSGAGNLTLNGSIASSNAVIGTGGTGTGTTVANILQAYAQNRSIYITAAGNESGRTFTVVGTVQTPGTWGTGIYQTETITGPNASTVSSTKRYSTIISIAVDAATAGAITVGVNGHATLDNGRRVLFTSGGNDSAVTATLDGTDWTGTPINETLTLSNGSTVYTVLDYLTVTSITTNAAIATTISIGTNGICSSPWARFDELGAMGPTGLQIDGSGSVNWTVSQTLQDPNLITNQLPTPTYYVSRAGVNWVNHPDSTLVGNTATTGVQGNYAYPPKFARITMNSNGGATAYAALTVLQNYQT